jgi:hypothetical protein
MLGEAVRLEVTEKMHEWQELLAEWNLKPFCLVFREDCTEGHWEGERYVAPPIELRWDQLTVRLIGEIQQASFKGLISSYDDQIGGLVKIWPEALGVACALQAPQIWMLKSGKSKTIQNPLEALKGYIAYYFRSLKAPSPLLSDWADALLRKGADELEKKMEKGSQFEDPVIDWVLARAKMPTAAEIFAVWGEDLRAIFQEAIALYPVRGKHHAAV